MIKNRTIYCGFGDIAVGADINGYLTIVNIAPPLKCGEVVKKNNPNIEYGKSIKIQIVNFELYDLIRTVSPDNRIIKYKKWTFDFSEYNEESVRVFTEKIDAAFNAILICLAC